MEEANNSGKRKSYEIVDVRSMIKKVKTEDQIFFEEFNEAEDSNHNDSNSEKSVDNLQLNSRKESSSEAVKLLRGIKDVLLDMNKRLSRIERNLCIPNREELSIKKIKSEQDLMKFDSAMTDDDKLQKVVEMLKAKSNTGSAHSQTHGITASVLMQLFERNFLINRCSWSEKAGAPSNKTCLVGYPNIFNIIKAVLTSIEGVSPVDKDIRYSIQHFFKHKCKKLKTQP